MNLKSSVFKTFSKESKAACEEALNKKIRNQKKKLNLIDNPQRICFIDTHVAEITPNPSGATEWFGIAYIVYDDEDTQDDTKNKITETDPPAKEARVDQKYAKTLFSEVKPSSEKKSAKILQKIPYPYNVAVSIYSLQSVYSALNKKGKEKFLEDLEEIIDADALIRCINDIRDSKCRRAVIQRYKDNLTQKQVAAQWPEFIHHRSVSNYERNGIKYLQAWNNEKQYNKRVFKRYKHWIDIGCPRDGDYAITTLAEKYRGTDPNTLSITILPIHPIYKEKATHLFSKNKIVTVGNLLPYSAKDIANWKDSNRNIAAEIQRAVTELGFNLNLQKCGSLF